MKYLIYDDIFYSDDENLKNGKSLVALTTSDINDTAVSICVVNTLTKVVTAPESSLEVKEKTLGEAFPSNYVIQDERISNNTFQVFAIQSELIKSIYSTLKNFKIVSVIPYGLALRAYINTLNLNVKNKTVVFIDRIADKLILSFIDEKIISRSTRLYFQNQDDIASEIKRYIQDYTSQGARVNNTTQTSFFYITNDVDVQSLLLLRNNVKQEEIVRIEESFPSLEGQKRAKFDIHFLLPEELARIKKIQNLKNRMKFLVGSGICFVIGLLIFFYGVINKSISEKERRIAIAQLNHVSEQLKIENTKRYKEYFKSKNKESSTFILFEFINNIPEDQIIENFEITQTKSNLWKFQGIISAETNSSRIKNFEKKGVFKDALVEYIVLNDKPAQRITFIFK